MSKVVKSGAKAATKVVSSATKVAGSVVKSAGKGAVSVASGLGNTLTSKKMGMLVAALVVMGVGVLLLNYLQRTTLEGFHGSVDKNNLKGHLGKAHRAHKNSH
jgi:hypothetical protein